jgi:peroxiredoxin
MQISPLEKIVREICAKEGPLRERLEDFSKALKLLDPEYVDAYDELISRLVAGRAGQTAPGIGDVMPPFLLPNHDGRLVSLAGNLDLGPAVISFNRGHWCEYCRIELAGLSQALNSFAAAGAHVIAIMPEAQEFIAQARRECGSAFTFLSDLDNGFALELGLVIWVNDRIRTLLLKDGVHLEKFHRNEACFLPIPATFVVDRDGRIAGRFVDPDFRRRMQVEEIIAVVESLKSRQSAVVL